MNATIDIFDPETGEAKTYKRYSARLPEFNTKFGPGTGYRVESDIRPLPEFQPLRMAAFTEAVRAGRNPEDVGLGTLNGLMVCTHRLIDSEGQVVCDARAAAFVQEYKDLEVLETASHQRLMARVGFGGDIFDDDEDREIQAVAGARNAAPATAETAPSEGQAETPPEPKAEPVKPARPARTAKRRNRRKAVTAQAGNGAEEAPGEATDRPTASAETRAGDRPGNGKGASGADRPPPVAMLSQLEQLAARAGVDMPEVTTFAEAKAQLKRLNKLAREAASS